MDRINLKKCNRCGEVKQIVFFYANKRMRDGHINQCNSCVSIYEKKRGGSLARKISKARSKARYVKNNPGIARAHLKTANAIRRGKIVKTPCVVCGDTKVQAHHPDYRKPLLVKWLCFKHHRIEHGTYKVAA